MAAIPFGRGVLGEIKGSKLCLMVDLDTVDTWLSESQKNLMLGSSQGNQTVAHGNQQIKFGLNVFKTPTPKEKADILKAQEE